MLQVEQGMNQYPVIKTWDIFRSQRGWDCGVCRTPVAEMTMDKQTVLACPNCSVSARVGAGCLDTMMRSRYTFPLHPWRG